MTVLAIEASTSSAKAVLYEPGKGITGRAQKPYPVDVSSAGRFDADLVYELTAQTARELCAGQNIDAVAISGIWHSLVLCGEDMRPVIPGCDWTWAGSAEDAASARADEELTQFLYTRSGCMPCSIYPRHMIRALRGQGVKVEDKNIFTQSGYIYYRLTGERTDSESVSGGTGLFSLGGHDYDDAMLEYTGIKRGQLGKPANYRHIGRLSKAGAEALGLKEGTPVVPAHPDGALNQVGSCCGRKGYMTMSVGTSGAVRLLSEKPALPAGKELWCYPGVEGWLAGAATNGACNTIEWFRREICGGKYSYSQLEAIDDENADTPVFLPFIYGERCPGWSRRRDGFYGSIDGVDPRLSYKAVQMGVLFNIYQCYLPLIKECGSPEKIVISGGISNSQKWLQMAADIFSREMLCADFPDASCMGAVALALWAAGALENISDFSDGIENARPVIPNPERRDYYARQYERYISAYTDTMP